MEKKIRVLLVEDDHDQINWARQQIGELCNLTVVTTAEEALSKLERAWNRELGPYDMVLMDLSFPRKEGTPAEFQTGINFFWKVFFEDEDVKIGILSTYEHHIVAKKDRWEMDAVTYWKCVLIKLDQHNDWYDGWEPGRVALVVDKPTANFNNYLANNKVVSREEAKSIAEVTDLSDLEEGTSLATPFVGSAFKGVIKPLKPYKEMFEHFTS